MLLSPPALTATSAMMTVFSPWTWARPGLLLLVPAAWSRSPLVPTSAVMPSESNVNNRTQMQHFQIGNLTFLGTRVQSSINYAAEATSTNSKLTHFIEQTDLSLDCDLDGLRPFEDFLSLRLDRSSPFSAESLSCSSSVFRCDFDGFSESLFRACFKKKLSLSGK